MEEKLLKIINHYGAMHQLKYFQSEVFELNEAIINCNTYDEATDIFAMPEHNRKYFLKHITEEIADVMVMIEQFKLYYGISSEEITNIFWQKVNRQLDRISKE